jgi:hypothetical protein
MHTTTSQPSTYSPEEQKVLDRFATRTRRTVETPSHSAFVIYPLHTTARSSPQNFRSDRCTTTLTARGLGTNHATALAAPMGGTNHATAVAARMGGTNHATAVAARMGSTNHATAVTARNIGPRNVLGVGR